MALDCRFARNRAAPGSDCTNKQRGLLLSPPYRTCFPNYKSRRRSRSPTMPTSPEPRNKNDAGWGVPPTTVRGRNSCEIVASEGADDGCGFLECPERRYYRLGGGAPVKSRRIRRLPGGRSTPWAMEAQNHASLRSLFQPDGAELPLVSPTGLTRSIGPLPLQNT